MIRFSKSDPRMESKTLNMVVIHKQSKWSRFKRRLGGWFSSDKVGSENRDLPQIIVTSAEESDLRTSGDEDVKFYTLYIFICKVL